MSDLIDAVLVLLTLALLVVLATAPSVWRTYKLRRLVPGMSWRTAWALTAPDYGDPDE